MSKLIGANGRPILNKTETETAEKQAAVVGEIMTLAVERKLSIDDLLSIGLNLILKGYEQVPPADERSYIDVTMSNMATAFGQITIVKRELAREARRAVEAMNQSQ